MVKIRLRRVGAKKQPSFRVVVADSQSPRDGRFIEQIGFYNPRTEPETLRIDEERALYWLNVGAQPSDSAARLLTTTGTMDRFVRLKQGEPLEDLLTEAEELLAAEPAEEPLEEEVPETAAEETSEAEPADAADQEPAEAGTESPVGTVEEPEETQAEPAPVAEPELEQPELDTSEGEEEEE